MAEKNATLTLARYRSTVRKLHAAYVALGAVAETAEYFDSEIIASARAAMSRVPDRLRVQVCAKCNKHGHYPKPDDPYVAVSCDHPDVPRFDVKTGNIKQ